MAHKARIKRKQGFAFHSSAFGEGGASRLVGFKRIPAPVPPEVAEEHKAVTGSAPSIAVPTEPGEISRDSRGNLYRRDETGALRRYKPAGDNNAHL